MAAMPPDANYSYLEVGGAWSGHASRGESAGEEPDSQLALASPRTVAGVSAPRRHLVRRVAAAAAVLAATAGSLAAIALLGPGVLPHAGAGDSSAREVEGALRARAAATGGGVGPRTAGVDNAVSLKVKKADLEAAQAENDRLRAQVGELEAQSQYLQSARLDLQSAQDENGQLRARMDELQAELQAQIDDAKVQDNQFLMENQNLKAEVELVHSDMADIASPAPPNQPAAPAPPPIAAALDAPSAAPNEAPAEDEAPSEVEATAEAPASGPGPDALVLDAPAPAADEAPAEEEAPSEGEATAKAPAPGPALPAAEEAPAGDDAPSQPPAAPAAEEAPAENDAPSQPPAAPAAEEAPAGNDAPSQPPAAPAADEAPSPDAPAPAADDAPADDEAPSQADAPTTTTAVDEDHTALTTTAAVDEDRTALTTTAAVDEEHACAEGYPLPYCAGQWPTEYDYSGQFPHGFVWGVGTAAYQIEGAYREDGRGASVWDVFTGADTVGMPGADCSYCCKEAPCTPNDGMEVKGSTGNVADDHYHMWRSDVTLMRSMGLRHYRFSISWPRVIPTGNIDDGVNQMGLDFYSDLIDGLLAAGITPYVTLFHWDLPQGLLDPQEGKNAWWGRDEDGVPNGQITKDYLAYADLCFSTFGDRVKMWFTFNEPWSDLWVGIPPDELNDHGFDPYIAAHNLLNAHAAAVDLYRTKYQPEQDGRIGIVLNSHWSEPKTDKRADIQASARSVAFTLAWFADPIFGGKAEYPPEMRKLIGDRLPNFTKKQRRLINGSADFFALNHYGADFVENNKEDEWSWNPQHTTSSHGDLLQGQSNWLFSAPWGLRKLLNYVDARYGHPQIYITESGWSIEANNSEAGAQDRQRVQYYANYTSELLRAIDDDGIDVRGYFAWSLVDNFEWRFGYQERFGITYRDFELGPDPRGPEEATRQPREGHQTTRRKESSCWLEQVWSTGSLVGPDSYDACVDAGIFEGPYIDAECSCRRDISIEKGSVSGTRCRDEEGACLGEADFAWESYAWANFSGGSIAADFSGVGGAPRLLGYWRRSPAGILWEDGSEWLRMQEIEMFKH